MYCNLKTEDKFKLYLNVCKAKKTFNFPKINIVLIF